MRFLKDLDEIQYGRPRLTIEQLWDLSQFMQLKSYFM